MKTLTIIRHAKSSWEDHSLNDRERPLLAKGEKRTNALSEFITEQRIIPDLVITSPATRAQKTLQILSDSCWPNTHVKIDESIYPGRKLLILETLGNQSSNINHIAVVGHNPGLTDLANHFTTTEITDWIPTSGMVTLQLNTNDWQNVEVAKGKIVHYVVPKQLLKK